MSERMKEICEALGFDPTNHHNASKCPYCDHGLAHRIAQLEAQQIWLYNQGYLAGHHDTVEAQFTNIYQVDMDTYHADVVAELLQQGNDDG